MPLKKSKVKSADLKLIFAEIINGQSLINVDPYGEIEIRHLNNLDSASIDLLRHKYFSTAESKGLPTEKSKLIDLNKEGSWTDADEQFLDEHHSYLENLIQTKNKLVLERDIKPVQKKIEEASSKIYRRSLLRSELLGLTCDLYADKKISEYYILFSLRKDNKPFLSTEEIEDLDVETVSKIKSQYNEKMKKFSSDNIKRISVSPFFLNFYFLCDKNPQVFYGKPIVELTFHQAELVTFARKYMNLMENAKNPAPDYLYDDPDGLIEYYEGARNADHLVDSGQDKDATTIVGATNKEMEKLGLDKQEGQSTKKISLAEQASKKGGSLSMQDLMKIHGVK